jgi:hypothetical protein
LQGNLSAPPCTQDNIGGGLLHGVFCDPTCKDKTDKAFP